MWYCLNLSPSRIGLVFGNGANWNSGAYSGEFSSQHGSSVIATYFRKLVLSQDLLSLLLLFWILLPLYITSPSFPLFSKEWIWELLLHRLPQLKTFVSHDGCGHCTHCCFPCRRATEEESCRLSTYLDSCDVRCTDAGTTCGLTVDLLDSHWSPEDCFYTSPSNKG